MDRRDYEEFRRKVEEMKCNNAVTFLSCAVVIVTAESNYLTVMTGFLTFGDDGIVVTENEVVSTISVDDIVFMDLCNPSKMAEIIQQLRRELNAAVFRDMYTHPATGHRTILVPGDSMTE